MIEVKEEKILELLGEKTYEIFEFLDRHIKTLYRVDMLWDKGGKYGDYCLRYRRSNKTLCTLYFRKEHLDIWIILGKEERARFECNRNLFSEEVQQIYDCTDTFHDGKWLMIHLEDDHLKEDICRLLEQKKIPLKK